jgi:hypothetical protein
VSRSNPFAHLIHAGPDYEDRIATDFLTAFAKAPKKPRPLTFEAALRKAARAGMTVRGAAIYADRVEITFGQPATAPEATALTPLQEWRAKHARQA